MIVRVENLDDLTIDFNGVWNPDLACHGVMNRLGDRCFARSRRTRNQNAASRIGNDAKRLSCGVRQHQAAERIANPFRTTAGACSCCYGPSWYRRRGIPERGRYSRSDPANAAPDPSRDPEWNTDGFQIRPIGESQSVVPGTNAGGSVRPRNRELESFSSALRRAIRVRINGL